MRAAVRSIYSSDVDIDTYASKTPDDDGVWIRVIAGPDNGPGDESFDILVCTPIWLRKLVNAEGPQFGRHRLVVDPLDLSVAAAFLRQQFEAVEASDWSGVTYKLSRLGHWEFEDYQP